VVPGFAFKGTESPPDYLSGASLPSCGRAFDGQPATVAAAGPLVRESRRQAREREADRQRSERYSAARHALGIHGCVTVTCRYVFPRPFGDDGSLRAAVEAAVAQVISKLGALRVGIAGHDQPRPAFVQVLSVDLRQHVEWNALDAGSPSYDSDLLGLIGSQHGLRFPDIDQRPPWRLVVVPNRAAGWMDAVFALHHAVGDGTSVSLFHVHLLEAFNHPAELGAALRGHVLTIPEPPLLVPAQEDVVNFRMSWPFFLRQAWKALAPPWLRLPWPAATPLWTANPVTFTPITTHLRLVRMAPRTAEALLSACRSNGATLTALLNALVCAVLARRLPTPSPRSFSAVLPISLRPFATAPAGSELDIATMFCNLVTVMDLPFPPEVVADLCGSPPVFAVSSEDSDDSRIWHLAARLRGQIKERLRMIPNDDVLDMLAWVPDFHAWIRQQEGQARGSTWEMSNLGSIAGEDKKAGGRGWTIRGPIFAQPANVRGAAFTVNVFGIRGDAVSLTLTWQEGIIEAELGEGVATDLQRCLDDFAKTGTFCILGRRGDQPEAAGL